jgi:outer membrane lipoprotein SlyB
MPAFFIALLAAVVTFGCAAPAPDYVEPEIRQGTIEQITPVNIANNHAQGLGAILGGAAGVGLGSLIGAGTGRDVAMIAGAIGGALVGNEVQRNNLAERALGLPKDLGFDPQTPWREIPRS